MFEFQNSITRTTGEIISRYLKKKKQVFICCLDLKITEPLDTNICGFIVKFWVISILV